MRPWATFALPALTALTVNMILGAAGWHWSTTTYILGAVSTTALALAILREGRR